MENIKKLELQLKEAEAKKKAVLEKKAKLEQIKKEKQEEIKTLENKRKKRFYKKYRKYEKNTDISKFNIDNKFKFLDYKKKLPKIKFIKFNNLDNRPPIDLYNLSIDDLNTIINPNEFAVSGIYTAGIYDTETDIQGGDRIDYINLPSQVEFEIPNANFLVYIRVGNDEVLFYEIFKQITNSLLKSSENFVSSQRITDVFIFAIGQILLMDLSQNTSPNRLMPHWFYTYDEQGEINGIRDFDIVFREIIDIDESPLPEPNFDGVEFNCVLTQIKNQITNVDQKYLNELNKKYFETGISINTLQSISRKLKFNFQIYNLFGAVWCKYTPFHHTKTIKFVSHNKHATEYDMKDIFGKNLKEKNITNLQETYDELNCIKVPMRDNNKMLIGIITPETIYKNLNNIMTTEANYYFWTDEIKNNPDLYKFCFNEASFEFKRFCNIYKLNNKYKTMDILNICKSANYWTPAVCFDKDYQSKYYGYDQNTAYAISYKSMPKYYNHYKFPRDIQHVYKCSSLKCLNLTGFTLIKDVGKLPKIMEVFFPLKSGYWYPNNELQFYKDNGITFKVEATAFSLNTTELNFPVDNKYLYKNMIGKFYMNRGYNDTEIKINNKSEFEHFIYLYKENICHINYKEQVLTIRRYNDFKKGYYHIHAYILAYQRMSMFEKLFKIKYEDLLKIKVDAIYTKKPYDELFNNKIYWKKENNYVYYEWMDVKNVKSQNEYEKIEIDLLQYSKIINILYNNNTVVILLRGPGGSGKSTYVEKCKFYNLAKAYPTNKQKENLGNSKDAYTYHMLFDIGFKKNPKTKEYDLKYDRNIYLKYSTIFIDEISMIPIDHIEIIVKKCADAGILLILGGDDCQLQPVKALNIFKAEHNIKYETIDFNTLYRQKDEKIKKYVMDLRKNPNLIPDDIPNIHWDDCNDFNSTKDIFIAFKNEDVDAWANSFNEPKKIESSTVHKYQGTTIKGGKKLYILLNSIENMTELLYTAVSRVEYYDQLIFVHY